MQMRQEAIRRMQKAIQQSLRLPLLERVVSGHNPRVEFALEDLATVTPFARSVGQYTECPFHAASDMKYGQQCKGKSDRRYSQFAKHSHT